MQITESLLKSIMDQYRQPLYYTCLRIVQRTDAAQDIVMETFEKLWFMRERVPYEKAKAFIYLVAKNRSRDLYRSHMWEMDNSNEADVLIDPIISIDRRDIFNRSFKIVRGMMQKKDSKKGLHVFINTYVNGLTSKEIGNTSTVTSTRQYIIGVIRRELA